MDDKTKQAIEGAVIAIGGNSVRLAEANSHRHQSGSPNLYRIAFDELVAVDAALAALRAILASGGWEPWAEVVPVLGKSVIAWRKDAGSFEAVFTYPRGTDDDDPPEEGMWFTASGEDLTGDLPTLFMDMPQPPQPGGEV